MVVMTPMGRVYLNRVRVAAGIDPKSGAIDPAATVDAQALESAIMSGRPAVLLVLGLGTIVVLAWLMMFKPF